MTTSDVVVREGWDREHEDGLMRLFAEQWWTADRTLDQTRDVIRGSSAIFRAVHESTGELVGFARVLTDGVFLALLLDVMVADAWRGRGVGALLMDAVTSHQMIDQVESFELVCQPQLSPFYSRWGFTDRVGTSGLMRRTARANFVS